MAKFISYKAENSAGWVKRGLRTREQAEKFLLPTLLNKEGTGVRLASVAGGNTLKPVSGSVSSEALESLTINNLPCETAEAISKYGFKAAPEIFGAQEWNYEAVRLTPPAVGFVLNGKAVLAQTPEDIAAEAEDEAAVLKQRADAALARAATARKAAAKK